MINIIYILTNNNRKFEEWKNNFRRYRIEVRKGPPEGDMDYPYHNPKEGEKVLAVCRETSNLYKPDTEELSERKHLDLVDNVTNLKVAYLDHEGKYTTTDYRHVTKGYIDRDGGKLAEEEDGWWDNIFRISSLHLTYEELRWQGARQSSREMAISQFILDRIHFSDRIDLQHNATNPTEAVRFDSLADDVVSANPLYSNEWAVKFGVTGAINEVLDTGVFVRAPGSPRERNYWWPPFAGLPLVPKKDAVHETTYQCHDLFHFLVPDLLPSFNFSTPAYMDLERRVYIAYRMMSEAVTLVLADMVFVDTLRRSGVQYDWTKRKIYPLFQALHIDLAKENQFEDNIRALLWANTSLCLLGDDQPYRGLLHDAGEGTEALDSYIGKYAAFFVEDFRWTNQNWFNMEENRLPLAAWRRAVNEVTATKSLGIDTTDAFIGRHKISDSVSTPDLVKIVYHEVVETKVLPALRSKQHHGRWVRIENAFYRYMVGQMGIFCQYRFLPEAGALKDKIVNYLKTNRFKLGSAGEIQRVRMFYNEFVDSLLARNLINHDDAKTYKGVYPLIDPYYVFYDRTIRSLEELHQTSFEILGK